MAGKEQVGYSRLAKTPLAESKATVHSVDSEESTARDDTSHGLHWKNPTLMACALLGGLIFALIHHFFYYYWNGKAVLDETQQQWITRGGTFFAFAFKVALAAGGGVAYVQFLWMSLRKRAYRVRDVDSMFSVLSNPLAFRLVKLWVRLPLLAVTAALVWLMPLAAIITPGSLTVVLTPEVTSQAGRVPSLAFDSQAGNFGTTDYQTGDFQEASNDVIRLAIASATSGSILQMNPPQPNSTYRLSFPGPAVRCSQGSLHDLTQLNNITTYNVPDPEALFNYMAWTPGQGIANVIYEPLQMPGLNETDFSYPIQSGGSAAPAPGYNVYIYANAYFYGAPFLLQCSLYNVTYTVDFAFDSGSQDLDIQSDPKGDLIPLYAAGIYTAAPIGTDPNPSRYNETLSYLSPMMAYGTILTGSIFRSAQIQSQVIQSTMLMSTLLPQRLQLAAADPSPDNATVRAAFEELFQNITFSLFSSAQYLLNMSDPTQALAAPTPIITSTLPVNKYSYNAFSLLTAYGAALAGEIICLTIGFYALHVNKKTYTNDFSTIMRATRKAELNALVVGGENDGADPAAEHMLNGLIRYHWGGDGKAGFGVGKEE